MKRSFLCFCVATLTSIASEQYSRAGEGAAEYQIYIVDPPINNQMIQEHRDLPAVCRPGTVLSLMACRGEYESTSFVVETNSQLNGVLVTVGELAGDAGTIPSSAVDVRVVQPCWLRVTDHPGRMNWVLLHDPALLKIVHEHDKTPYSAGMSFTRRPVDTEVLQAADVAKRQQFWLTVQVPDDALAGNYSAAVVITSTNATTRKLTLKLKVPGFDLRKPNFEYSVFYASKYHNDKMRSNEYQNMAAHGCMNPAFHDSVTLAADEQTLDFTVLGHELDLREQVGMAAGGPLYFVSSGPINAGTTGLSNTELAQLTARVEETVVWIRGRGYSDVYFMGADEAIGDKLLEQRPTWKAIHKGGGKVFISNYGGFFPHVGEMVDLAVVTHPSGNPIDVANTTSSSPDSYLANVSTFPWVTNPIDWILDPVTHNKFNPPNYPDMIRRVHDNGFKIFTYMDSLAGGYGIPEVQRRLRGLGLWMAKLDGTMTWSYHHFRVGPHLEAGPLHWSNFHSFVLRGAEAPFDTLAWEGYREGYDDARYLATLQQALADCRKNGTHQAVAAEAEAWLERVPTDVDLNDWRRQLATRIEALVRRESN